MQIMCKYRWFFPPFFKASCYYIIPFSKILPRIPAYCFLAFGFMILKGNFYCEWSRFGHMPGANRREKKEGFIFLLSPSISFHTVTRGI